MATHNNLGKWGEQQAAEYLQRKGYRICHRNWRMGHRDLDITALTPDGDTMVVVEVKTRSHTDYASPEESVDWRKMRNLAIAANAYVRRYQLACDIRFDIITVVGDGSASEIDHIVNAFIPPMM
jgi:putative endonuclease